MPKPKQRRRYPKPKPITILHQDKDAPDVVSADRFLAYQYARQARPVFSTDTTDQSFNYIELQRYFGLKTGDAIVPLVARGGGLLWFVVDVDGPGQTVTARTVIFGGRREDTFKFTEIELQSPRTIEDAIDAAEARRRLGLPVSPQARRSCGPSPPRTSTSRRFRRSTRSSSTCRQPPLTGTRTAARAFDARRTSGDSSGPPETDLNRMPRLRKPRTAAAAIEDHVRRFFKGHTVEPREWPTGPVKTRVPSFGVYEAGPGPRFRGWSYVTTGCWEATARNEHGLEFVLSASERSLRHVEILAMVAYYHAGPANQRVDLGHTLDIGEPWTKQSLCTHLLISLPYAYGPELEICAWPTGHARLLAVQPITAAERAFKIEHGVEALEQRLEDANAEFSSPYRPSVV